MYYELNVSLNGSHYFATHERSITTKEKALKMARDFSFAFPISQGYTVSITCYETIGKNIKYIPVIS